jgi:hypothetical protein
MGPTLLNVSSAATLAHSGHWAGGTIVSLVIVGLGVAVWLRERRTPSDGD